MKHTAEESALVTASHRLNGEKEVLRAFYDEWAQGYVDTAFGEKYVGHWVCAKLLDVVAHALVKSGRPHSARILDAGCGTGLVGEQLAGIGYGEIDGVDLSAGMVEQARKTNAYSQLTADVDLNVRNPAIADDRYDLVVCCGVFIDGHVAVTALDELLRVARSSGYLVVSTRQSYLDHEPFVEYVERLAEDGKVRVVMRIERGNYINVDTADYWVLEKTT
ncbi:class I SAM-dependent DNA methyltransferase [Pseudomonas canadensis]|jgi:predicted TPR repeat methyltransferase|uniref:class I SAM-dependent DNA methyltransferase n=1 Tax=Pseudomonas canadensis TaxID=915099 RepID=UPI001F47BB4C|nr:class I SAM-dependent methyltransferase [Pseudomonas canadensis]MCF5169352.1 methyltransferase domain-containing protein [Pseudomonas canadensis]